MNRYSSVSVRPSVTQDARSFSRPSHEIFLPCLSLPCLHNVFQEAVYVCIVCLPCRGSSLSLTAQVGPTVSRPTDLTSAGLHVASNTHTNCCCLLSCKQKHKMIVPIVIYQSVLLYGCETWLVTKEIQRKIQTFVNRCLRHIY